MNIDVKMIVISHAGIKQINRSVYVHMKQYIKEIRLVVPASLTQASGKMVLAEPARADDPAVIPLELIGSNPRTYFYPKLISCLDEYLPNVILLENDPVSRLGFQLSRWCSRNGAKLICQTYENLRRDFKSTIHSQGWRALIKNTVIQQLNYFMAKRIDALLVVNADSEEIFNNYKYKRVFMIPLGYDPSVFFVDNDKRVQYRKHLGIEDHVVLIAYFGRLVPQKGVHLLIQSLSRLKELNWMLLLDHIHDSEGGYAASVQDAIEHDRLEDRVRYFEADHFEIANYMRAADIAVAPSVTTPLFKEQYGRAVQEAMACGCISLVSDSGHLKDLVGDNALVFREGNSTALSDLLKQMIENRSRREQHGLFLQSRARMLTIQVQATRLMDLLRDMNEN